MAVALKSVNESIVLHPLIEDVDSPNAEECQQTMQVDEGFVTAIARVGTQYRVVRGDSCGWCDSASVAVHTFPAFFVINDTLQATIKARQEPSAQCEEGAIYLSPGDIICAYELQNNWLRIKVPTKDSLQDYWLLKQTQTGIELALPAIPSLFLKNSELPRDAALRKRSVPSATNSVVVDMFTGEYVLGMKIEIEGEFWVWVCDQQRSFMAMYTPDKSIQLLTVVDAETELQFLHLSYELPAGASLRLRQEPSTQGEVVSVIYEQDVLAIRKDYKENSSDNWCMVLVEPFCGTWCVTKFGEMSMLQSVLSLEDQRKVEEAPIVENTISNQICFEDTPIKTSGHYSYGNDIDEGDMSISEVTRGEQENADVPVEESGPAQVQSVKKSIIVENQSMDSIIIAIDNTIETQDCAQIYESPIRERGAYIYEDLQLPVGDANHKLDEESHLIDSIDKSYEIYEKSKVEDGPVVSTPQRPTLPTAHKHDDTPITAKGVYMIDGEVIKPLESEERLQSASRKRSTQKSHVKRSGVKSTPIRDLEAFPLTPLMDNRNLSELNSPQSQSQSDSLLLTHPQHIKSECALDESFKDVMQERNAVPVMAELESENIEIENDPENIILEEDNSCLIKNKIEAASYDGNSIECEVVVVQTSSSLSDESISLQYLQDIQNEWSTLCSVHILPEHGLEDLKTINLLPLAPVDIEEDAKFAYFVVDYSMSSEERECIRYLDLLPAFDVEALGISLLDEF